MGTGRNYNKPINNEDDEEKTSKIKKVTITQEESNVAEASPDENEPVPSAGEKPVKDREVPAEEESTSDDDRYRASSTG